MNLIARCPACTTVFRVLPDQLKVSAGWVRCGRCESVFDAQLHQLVVSRSAAAGLNTSAPASAHTVNTPIHINPHTAQPDAAWAAAASPSFMLTTLATTGVSAKEATQPHAKTESGLGWDARVEPTGFDPSVHASPAPLGSPHPIAPPTTARPPFIPSPPTPNALDIAAPFSAAEAPTAGLASELEPSSAPPLEQQILQQAKQQAFWRQHWVRAALGLMAVGLAVLLSSQIAAFERQALLTHYPQSYGALQTLCKLAPCDSEPLTMASSIVLESSSFERVNTPDQSLTYLLQWAVHNKANHPVAVPALELSLTDAYDRTQVRRVLPAKELGWTAAEMGDGQTWQGQLQFRLDMPRNATPITNYRLMVFYP